jgi:hypothetical protein
MTEREKVQYDLQLQDKKTGRFTDKSLERMRRLFVVKILVDENNQRIFSDEDEFLLQDVDGRCISMIYDEGQLHCGYNQSDIEELGKE